MTYDDDNILSISGIQHFVFCRRQWALIHIEQQWAENLLTVSGEIMHNKAHDNTFSETRNGVIVSRGMQVASYELGIFGECDVVEFIPSESGALLYDKPGKYTIIPVEYKHGEPKVSDADILQVAAQALCLENMFCTSINEVHIFYGKTKRRQRIELTDDIRNRLKSVVEEMHELYRRKYTPKVKQNKNCRACSLKDLCLPKITKIKTVKRYISDMTKED